MKFKIWFESNEEEEWSQDEIEQAAFSANSKLERRIGREKDGNNSSPFGPIPEYVDPDDFFQSHGGGVFTFTYSQRKLLNPQTKQYEPEGLKLASWATTHRYMAYKVNHILNPSEQKYPHPMLTGRYGIKSGVPIVALWNDTKKYLVTPCLKELLQKNLVAPDAYLFADGENRGTLEQILNLRKPSPIIQKNVEKVKIGDNEYTLSEIPALLHSLPSGSLQHKQIAYFICQDTNYPFLKQFRQRAGCLNGMLNKSTSSTPDFLNRRSYWNTSENIL